MYPKLYSYVVGFSLYTAHSETFQSSIGVDDREGCTNKNVTFWKNRESNFKVILKVVTGCPTKKLRSYGFFHFCKLSFHFQIIRGYRFKWDKPRIEISAKKKEHFNCQSSSALTIHTRFARSNIVRFRHLIQNILILNLVPVTSISLQTIYNSETDLAA